MDKLGKYFTHQHSCRTIGTLQNPARQVALTVLSANHQGDPLFRSEIVAMDSDVLLARLGDLAIRSTTVNHPPLRTVEDSKRLRGDLPGAHVKNLFLRDKHKRFWLLVTHEDRPVDLKAMARALDAGRFSFANETQLAELLGIAPGSVSPLAAINDVDGAVTVVLDDALLQIDPINLHPLRNDRTTAIAPADLLRFLAACDHPPRIIDFGGVSPSAA